MRRRCKWCNPDNPKYVAYHDEEWGKLRTDDAYLFEMLILESFQAGLSWECILNKRENFRKAYEDFDLDKVCAYDQQKIDELLANTGIVRNKLKIKASVGNAQVFKEIRKEYQSFWNYLRQFTDDQILYEEHQVTNALSDAISKDLKKRGMKFVGSTIIYAYLQAIGVINSHEKECDLYAPYEMREIHKEEAEEAAEVEAVCFPPSEACTLEIMKERIQAAKECFLVAIDRETGKMIGFINGLCTDEEILRDELFTNTSLHNPQGKNVMICGVDVLPEYRLHGIARNMMKEFLRRQTALGREKAILTCVPGKISMYEKFGYTDRGASDSEWGGEAWHEMYCELRS